MSEHVSKAMRQRLLANREGRLSSEQWRELVTEPLTPLLILMIPGIFVAGRVGARGLLFVAAIAAVVFALPLIFRAWRYSRPTIEHATLYTSTDAMARWLLWKPLVLYTARGEPLRFRRRVAPLTILKPDTAYLVYYLQEANAVLLSLAPDDHPDSLGWRPKINS